MPESMALLASRTWGTSSVMLLERSE